MSVSYKTLFLRYPETLKVNLTAGANKIYPKSLIHYPCCRDQKCYTRLEDGTAAEGIVKEQVHTLTILRETGKCKRRTKVYEPVNIELSVSCNCLYAPV